MSIQLHIIAVFPASIFMLAATERLQTGANTEGLTWPKVALYLLPGMWRHVTFHRTVESAVP